MDSCSKPVPDQQYRPLHQHGREIVRQSTERELPGYHRRRGWQYHQRNSVDEEGRPAIATSGHYSLPHVVPGPKQRYRAPVQNECSKRADAVVVANAKIEGLAEALNMCKRPQSDSPWDRRAKSAQPMMHICPVLHFSSSATSCSRFLASELLPQNCGHNHPYRLSISNDTRSRSKLTPPQHYSQADHTEVLAADSHGDLGHLCNPAWRCGQHSRVLRGAILSGGSRKWPVSWRCVLLVHVVSSEGSPFFAAQR